MDTDRIYKNPGLEARRLALLRQLKAEQALRASREGTRSIDRQIELGFRSFDKQKKTPLTQWIAQSVQPLNAKQRRDFRELLFAMAELRSPMLHERKHVGAMA